jgi:hypothetical protein
MDALPQEKEANLGRPRPKRDENMKASMPSRLAAKNQNLTLGELWKPVHGVFTQW